MELSDRGCVSDLCVTQRLCECVCVSDSGLIHKESRVTDDGRNSSVNSPEAEADNVPCHPHIYLPIHLQICLCPGRWQELKTTVWTPCNSTINTCVHPDTCQDEDENKSVSFNPDWWLGPDQDQNLIFSSKNTKKQNLWLEMTSYCTSNSHKTHARTHTHTFTQKQLGKKLYMKLLSI